MPVYVYRCDSCGSQVEKRQSFTDAPLTECESCGGSLRKVLQPTAIVFKGSGFYVTDNRSSGSRNGVSSAVHDRKNGDEARPSGSSPEPVKETGKQSAKEKTGTAASAD